MNILFFHSSMQGGGAERNIALLSSYALKKDNKVTIVTIDGLESFYPLPVNLKHIKMNKNRNSRNLVEAISNNISIILNLRRIFSDIQPDIIIAFQPDSILQSKLASCFMKCKLVGSERTNPIYYNNAGFWNKNRQRFSYLCDGFIFQTIGAKKYYPEYIQNKSIILGNGILVENYCYFGKGFKERRDLCAVGRMDADKCFEDIISAFSIVHKLFPTVKLDMYGDGPVRAKLEQQAERLGIASVVIFHGKCKTIIEEYSKHKIFLMASRVEGFPNVLLEAMASGCACVVANCDFGPAELINDGINGFLVPVHDVGLMVQYIRTLLDDQVLCENVSNAAKSVRQVYDIKMVGDKFCRYLESVKGQ